MSFDPGITVVSLDNFVGYKLDIALYHVFVETTTDQAFHCKQGVRRIGYCLAFRRLADDNFAFLVKGDD